MPPVVVITAKDIGNLVQDAHGRVGILRDVVRDFEDPAVMPSERRPQSMAFLIPENGGREWLAPPNTVSRLQARSPHTAAANAVTESSA
ncbi:hypothetical protein SLA_2476 [Streptomyces laurentii]|uniref:Uncharacterized protein n=1 Tax=Streptomyces laurentii TaxID=39478 RepID=A0A160NZK3_STRLU|nr:hypothetical protein SLA_2476 [Streptomyces laurentii]